MLFFGKGNIQNIQISSFTLLSRYKMYLNFICHYKLYVSFIQKMKYILKLYTDLFIFPFFINLVKGKYASINLKLNYLCPPNLPLAGCTSSPALFGFSPWLFLLESTCHKFTTRQEYTLPRHW